MIGTLIDAQKWQKYGEPMTTAIIECENVNKEKYYQLYDLYPNDVVDLRSFNTYKTIEEAHEALHKVTGISMTEWEVYKKWEAWVNERNKDGHITRADIERVAFFHLWYDYNLPDDVKKAYDYHKLHEYIVIHSEYK